MRWASAGGRGSGRRGGCCCPHPRRRRRRHRCSAPCLGETSCAVRDLEPLRGPRPHPRGAGWGLGRPTRSPDGRVLHRGAGCEDGLLPLAFALPIALPFPLPLGGGRGGGFCQVSWASWKPKGLRLSPRDRKPPHHPDSSSGMEQRGQGVCPRTPSTGVGAVTWGQRRAAEPAAEVLGCGGEVGEAVHGGGRRAWRGGHQHRQMWHLRQVDDACGRGGGAGGCSHVGRRGARLPARWTPTQRSTAHPEKQHCWVLLLGPRPRSECQLLGAPPPFAPKP